MIWANVYHIDRTSLNLILFYTKVWMLLRWRNTSLGSWWCRLRRKQKMWTRSLWMLSRWVHFCARPIKARLFRMPRWGTSKLIQLNQESESISFHLDLDVRFLRKDGIWMLHRFAKCRSRACFWRLSRWRYSSFCGLRNYRKCIILLRLSLT